MKNLKDISARKWLLAIVLIAVLIRLFYVIIHDPIPEPAFLDLDETDFNYLAHKFASGQGLTDKYGAPTNTRFPLYPIFLGVIYFLFGWHSNIAFLFQALLGGLTPVFVYIITRHFFQRRISLLAAFITAVYPSYIQLSGRLMSENVFIPLLALLIIFVLRLSRDLSVFNAVATGILLGLAALARGVAIPLLLIVPLYALFAGGGDFRGRLKNTALMAAALLLVLTPWVIRNYINSNRLFITSSSGGVVLWMSFDYLPAGSFFQIDRAYEYVDSVGREKANLEEFHRILMEDNIFGWKGMRKVLTEFFKDRDLPDNEVDINRMLISEVKKQIKAHPEVFIVKTVREFLRFWHFIDHRGGYTISYGVILPFFLCGIWLLRRRFTEFAPLLAFFIYTWAIETVFMADARFRMPFEMVMIVIGAYCIYEFFRRVKPVGVPLFLTAVLLGVNIFLFCNASILRGAIRGAAGAVGIPITGTGEDYVPHLKDSDSTGTEIIKDE